MPTAFNVMAAALLRLAALHHATETTTRSSLAHIHLIVTGDDARFTACDGRLLALLRLPVSEFDGEPTTVLIDGALFTAACNTLLRADHASTVRIAIEDGEVRFTRGTAVAVARIHDLAYPITSAFLNRYRGQSLVPAIATFVPALITAAARIAGKRTMPLLLWSPTSDADLAQCWSREAEPEITIPRAAISGALSQPGIWADQELFLLLMPTTRSADNPPEIDAVLASPSTPSSTSVSIVAA